MEPLPVLRLHPGREKALERHHPWVFSGAIARMEGSPADGDLVRIADAEGRIRAVGHYQASSIAVRILAYEDRSIDLAFYLERFQQALAKRRLLGLLDNP
ncbi:MAG: class I SAM-dependent rRNA methyltransferase, partial [Bacteroidetes bacterium]